MLELGEQLRLTVILLLTVYTKVRCDWPLCTTNENSSTHITSRVTVSLVQ